MIASENTGPRRSVSRAIVSAPGDAAPHILICLLGVFRVLRAGRPVGVHGESKMGAMLSVLALHERGPVAREEVLDLLWPEQPLDLASQSLHSLLYDLRKRLGVSPVVGQRGAYSLNVEAGVRVDISLFETLALAGERQAEAGNRAAAIRHFERALQLYEGDLCPAPFDLQAVIVRERLRGLFVNLLMHLAEACYVVDDFAGCLVQAGRLLAHDACREDAHRLVMRCHMRLGQRTQALRQYRLCEQALSAEFDAPLEPATIALFDQIRLDPNSV